MKSSSDLSEPRSRAGGQARVVRRDPDGPVLPWRRLRRPQLQGLMSYGPNPADLFRRAATYVDKILECAKPAELPVEQRTKLKPMINLKTAKALGLTIPPSVLARADE